LFRWTGYVNLFLVKSVIYSFSINNNNIVAVVNNFIVILKLLVIVNFIVILKLLVIVCLFDSGFYGILLVVVK